MFRCGATLIFALPFGVGHTVNDLASLFIIHIDSFILRRRSIPFAEAIPAEARKVHQVDILYLGVFTEMRHKPPEDGSLQFDFCWFVQSRFSLFQPDPTLTYPMPMPKTPYRTGQKWVSTAEPELGMGRIEKQEGRFVTLIFDLVHEVRTYARDRAPITRVRFSEGDRVRSSRFALVVESVTEADGLFVYHGHYQGRQTAMIETDLDPDVRFSKPQQRLHTGGIDDNRWFNLRYLTLKHRADLAQSPVRGLLGPRVSLVPHQFYIASEVGSRYAPRVLLADEVGLGKTIEAGLILHRQLATGRARRALIIVPPALKFQWFVEMIRRFNLRFTLLDEERCRLIEKDNRGADDADDRLDNPFEAQQLVLCSLDLFANPLRLDQAMKAPWGLVIVDEAHHLRYSRGAPSNDYRAVESLAGTSKGLLLLTATPEQLGRRSHFSRLRLLDPSRYHSFEDFIAEESRYEGIARLIRELTGEADSARDKARESIRDLLDTRRGDDDELIAALLDRHGTGRVLFRNQRDSVGGFPSRRLRTYPLEGTEDLTDIAKDPRVAWLSAHLSARKDKYLVICSKTDTAIKLELYLRRHTALGCACFHEAMDLVSRDRAANYFADSERGAQVLVCSEIGSEGRNFQFASNLVMFDLPPSPDLLEQRIGRLDRIGQTRDVTIHVPYIENTSQHHLLRWYMEGLKLFLEPAPVARKIFDAHLDRFGHDDLENIIKMSRRATDDQLARLAKGRNRLLERNSHRPSISARLLEQIKDHEASDALESYMELSFDLFGLASEPLMDKIHLVKPTETRVRHGPVSAETMGSYHYPELPEEGISITYDRNTALAREDIQFITWESPWVEQAMDAVLSDSTGNCSVIAVALAGIPSGTLLLETIHLVECPTRRELVAERFLPAQLVRCLMTGDLEDLAEEINFKPFDNTLDISTDALAEIVTAREGTIKAMLDAGAKNAARKLEPVKAEALSSMNHFHDLEIERLTRLARHNPNVRKEEIDYLINARETLTAAITSAEVRLDALRLIIVARKR